MIPVYKHQTLSPNWTILLYNTFLCIADNIVISRASVQSCKCTNGKAQKKNAEKQNEKCLKMENTKRYSNSPIMKIVCVEFFFSTFILAI